MKQRKRGEVYDGKTETNGHSRSDPKTAMIGLYSRTDRLATKGSGVTVQKVEHHGRGHDRVATLQFQTNGRVNNIPSHQIGRAISDALDPRMAPSKCRSFSDMSEEEREKMRRLYERKP